MMAAERETDYRSGNLDFARSLARHQAYIVRCPPLNPPTLYACVRPTSDLCAIVVRERTLGR
jgi:hypothetical protein